MILLIMLLLEADSEKLLMAAYWPEPTAKMQKLVKEMGDENFFIREKAHQQLQNMGYQSLKACLYGTKDPDREISWRCQRIINDYLHIKPTAGDFPGIFKLPYDKIIKRMNGKKIKLIDRDDAYYLYKDIVSKMSPYDVQPGHDREISMTVSKNYFRKLLVIGVDKEYLIKILDTMQTSEDNLPPWLLGN